MNTDVFILSGSTLSVNDNNENVAKTMQILESGLKMNKNLRLLGLCFGHQAIAKHFGGEVERKNPYSGI
jgi:GMP synthase-like glutamine amidotransferase